MGSGVTAGRRGGVLKSERPKGTDIKSLAVWSGMHTAGALYISVLAAHAQSWARPGLTGLLFFSH